jgi:hypothetical protein
MPVTISGSTGITNVDGSAGTPAEKGATSSTAGVFFPAVDTVAISTASTERVRVGSAGQIGIAGANYGTSGQVLTSGGASAAPSWAALPAGGFSNLQVFTSTGTFTVPADITKVKVTVVGGGGGGGGYAGSYATNGIGGSGGGAAIKIVSGLTPSGTVSVTVGTGGAAGGTGSTSRGGTGGTSSFGAYCSATGGGGGYNSQQAGGNAPVGVGGSGSSGDLNLNGNGPSFGVSPGGCNEGWNIGGNSFLGSGGINQSVGTDQSPIYGGGGAGTSISGAPASATGQQAGANGIVIVEY